MVNSCSLLPKTTIDANAGSRMENAIEVSNITEEYEYVRKICPKCKLLGQSLVFDNDENPYDVLTFRKPSGEEVAYYFDISEFYGKAFD